MGDGSMHRYTYADLYARVHRLAWVLETPARISRHESPTYKWCMWRGEDEDRCRPNEAKVRPTEGDRPRQRPRERSGNPPGRLHDRPGNTPPSLALLEAVDFRKAEPNPDYGVEQPGSSLASTWANNVAWG